MTMLQLELNQDVQREGPPEYSGKMLGSSIQGIQAESSVGSENDYFSKVDNNNFHKNVNKKKKS